MPSKNNSDNEPATELKTRQNREKRELQAKITALKHALNKNDKKGKKELSLQIEAMEKELAEQHALQLKELQSLPLTDESATSKDDIGAIREKDLTTIEGFQPHSEVSPSYKRTKAQIRREKKAEDVRRKAAAILADELNSETSQARIEKDTIAKLLFERKLQLVDIPPDGDCLYNALSYQIGLCDGANVRDGSDKNILQPNFQYSGAELRKLAARHIRENPADFLPFIASNDAVQDKLTLLAEYCNKVERTSQEGGEWGGEAEVRKLRLGSLILVLTLILIAQKSHPINFQVISQVQAISDALKRRIEIIRSSGQTILFGKEYKGTTLIVIFLQHAYTLGEHYNSTCDITPDR